MAALLPPELQAPAGRLAGFICMAGFAPYFREMLRSGARPNRATWWIWTAAGAIMLASYRAAGGEESIWVPAAYVAGPFLVALASLRWGVGGWSRLDRACLAAAFASLIGWWWTENPLVSLGLNMLIDAIGAVPTVYKTWLDPKSESAWAWLVFFAADLLNLGAVPDWSNPAAAYPSYLAILGVVMWALCWLRLGRRLPAA